MNSDRIPQLVARVLASLTLLLPTLQLTAQNQLPNLPTTPAGDRFTLTDRVWPANPGEASLCMWADDKLAALSFTVDDNTQPDIAWWLAKSEIHGFPITWFVITGRVGSANSYWGTWSEYSSLVDLGHDIQSHTVWHLGITDPDWAGVEAEYRDSQAAIEANISYHAADFLAYPGGPNQHLNDRNLAASYYGAARGVTARINRANRIDYLSVNAMSSVNIGNTSAPWSNLESLLDPATDYFRGWAVLIYHKVNDIPAAESCFEFCDQHDSDLWVGAFGDIAKYGQERDTASLAVTSSTAQAITFTLSDQMLDSRFNHPLTVKVRLPDDWLTVKASQNGLPVDSRLVIHDDSPYALVQAVPDQGVVTVSPESPVIAYEDFNYAPTTTVSNSADSPTDIGWTGVTWSGSNDIVTPGLQHIAIPSHANALKIGANVSTLRDIDMTTVPAALTQVDSDGVTRLGKPGTTLWIRFLIRPDDNDSTGDKTAGLQLYGATYGGTTKLNIGDLGSSPGWGIRGKNLTPDAYDTAPITTGETSLLVTRIKFVAGAGNDEIDLFVNPAASPEVPATPDASLRGIDVGTFHQINLKGDRQSLIDEVAIGTEWSSIIGDHLTADHITSNGVTWIFSTHHRIGSFINGDPWVVGPVTVISISNNLNSPAYTPRTGQNGSMVNPGTGNMQGYESGLDNYIASLNAGLPNGLPVSPANPLVLPNATTLISSVSWLFNSSTDMEPGAPLYDNKYGTPRSATRSAGILTVLETPPDFDAFRPPYCGTDKSIYFRASQLNYSHIPALPLPADVTPPDFATLADRFSRTWLDHVYGWLGAANHPTLHMPNYGRDMSRLIGDATLRLFTDDSPLGLNPDKDRLIIGLVQLGIDSAGIADNDGGWPADGGHGQGRKWPILFAGALLNDSHMLNAGNWSTRFQEDEQTFYVSQTEVNITNSPAWSPNTKSTLIPYNTADIGTPEWGIRHSYEPQKDNASFDAYYRAVNGSVIPAFALAARHMGLKQLWDHEAFFDYCDRYMTWRLTEPPAANKPSAFLVSMWNAHRSSAAAQ